MHHINVELHYMLIRKTEQGLIMIQVGMNIGQILLEIVIWTEHHLNL
jgi:hypothetical protein